VPQKSEKNIDMAEIIYYGKKDVEMRRIYFIRMYGKICSRKADDKINPRCQCHESDGI